ncbi:MAG: hypothetical protein QGI21_03265 [Candidatus Poseidoniaceae archaeon]|jgi:hypothetical protein|nr:hypothetical protein [Candidatus Poseidoniaceae archaeon]
MAGGRGGKPRVRETRNLGLKSEGAPSKQNPEPISSDGMWFIPEPLSNRLHQKSAIGITVEGGILLSPEEVMFCHWHRHVPISENWFSERVAEDETFPYRAVAFDVSRSGGEKVVPRDSEWFRWARDSHPNKGSFEAKIIWARAAEELNYLDLLTWVQENQEGNCLSEIAIVDDEMDVTMYRLSKIDPVGSLTPATKEKHPHLGTEQMSRRFLREDEKSWLSGEDNQVTRLFTELNSRGLLMRPGFKYGCRWRVYATPVDEDHAPWLMQMVEDSPKNWEGICLSVRLAEGVNKGWVIAIFREGWNFLMFRRHLPGR